MTIYYDDSGPRIRRPLRRRTSPSGNEGDRKKAEKITRESREHFNAKGKKEQR